MKIQAVKCRGLKKAANVKNMIKKTFLSIITCCALLSGQSSFSQVIGDYTALPPTVVDSTTPLVMLVMSRDNQLWHKAYNDYSDLDGDGELDTTYNDNFEYYGYFHSSFCYSYSQSNELFSPVARVNGGTHQCSGAWSGNFLNWMTTSRIDVVRKVLYGGFRHIDTNDQTVIQRAYIPSDNHAFVKLVSNDRIQGSISDYTPITGRSDLSFCNTTDVNTGNTLSARVNTSDNAPRLKVAIGRILSWAGSESRQCQYTDEGGPSAFSAQRPSSGSISGIPSQSELVVRVEVCVDGFDADDNEFCQEYTAQDGSTNYKPYGLLQTYGETGIYKFGLMTGSYIRRDEGGVLRKNISFMGGSEADADDLEIDSNTGIFINQDDDDEGIIKTLNLLRIQGWDHSRGVYIDCDAPGIAVSTYLTSNSFNRQCRDWGNPITETYLEALRYIGGNTPTADFNVDDSGILTGLNTADWEDPYSPDVPCSNCSIIVLSTGLNNFDGDDLNSAFSLPGFNEAELRNQTDIVGIVEGFTTGTYIIGRGTSGGTTDACDAKFLANFSSATGPCPEVPSLQGTYNISGASLFASQNDLRADLEGVQNAETYTVSLAETLPSFEIPPGSGNSITIVPTCRSNSSGAATRPSDPGQAWRDCSLVDLNVVQPVGTSPEIYGRFVIAWEDSPWGFDYDQDAYSVIEYCAASGNTTQVRNQCEVDSITDQNTNYHNDFRRPRNGFNYRPFGRKKLWGSANPGEIQIRVSVPAASAGFSMSFGYTVSGSVPRVAPAEDNDVDNDGRSDSSDTLIVVNSGDSTYLGEIIRYGNYNFNNLNGALPNLGQGPNQSRTIWSNRVRRFTPDPNSNPGLLENPLWYAAKFGNFNDINGSGTPDQVQEWDNFDLEGNPIVGGDGIPDAFFPVSNPASLPAALNSVFSDINTRVSAGSAAAVNAQTGSGEGAIYQALYTPRSENDSGQSVTWLGTVNALFIDTRGRIREDADGNGALTSADRILELRFDEIAQETLAQPFGINADGTTGAPDGDPFPLTSNQYRPIWSALEQLSNVGQYTSNRTSYTSSASGGRFIFTSFDRDGDGQVLSPVFNTTNPGPNGQDGYHPFEAGNFSVTGVTSNDNRLLGFEGSVTEIEVENLVNFIRGEEGIAGFRSRTLQLPGGDQSFLLGDIVHSTPEVVSRPRDRYDLIYNDDSYEAFLEQYRNRRNVLYVGANDGMLHAFNAGVFNPETIAFEPSGHPLGSELWAYIPYNALPHLQWLASPNYQHVYYVDGPVRAFDVNIFPSDDVHPHGWGTIIVASMRFGGGDYSLDHDNDASTPDITTRSSYIIMDVTDPERPPVLLAEITDEQLGFTTAEPTVVKYRQPRSNGSFIGTTSNAWYLVFGSGPGGDDTTSRREALENATSSRNAYVYTFDLQRNTLQPTQLITSLGTPEEDSFAGGFAVADWDLDFSDDAFYFGLVSGTPETPEGKLKRGRITSISNSGLNVSYTSDLYNDTNRAFSATPFTLRDANNDYWVYAGTGRFFVPQDNVSDQQQYYYGIKEPEVGGVRSLDRTVGDSELVDTTEVDVFTDGRVFNNGSTARLSAGGRSEDVETFNDILEFVEDNGGWRFQFRNPNARNNDVLGRGIRNTTQAALAGQSIIITAYDGTGEFCNSEGEGFLFAPHFGAGVPAPFSPVGTDSNVTIAATDPGDPREELVLQGITLGVGIPSEAKIIRPSESNSASGGGSPNCEDFKAITQSSSAQLSDTGICSESSRGGRQGWIEAPVE